MKTYKINLLSDVEKRWLPIIKSEGARIKRLTRDSRGRMILPKFFGGSLTWIINKLYETVGGDFEYSKDIGTIAELLKIEKGDLTCANLEYELAMCFVKNPFACTAAVLYRPGIGMIHIRNMDWPGRYIGKYTIKVVYDSHYGEFTAITWPGYVGVLSGVAKNRFSATINMLPWPNFIPWPKLNGWPASFLLRYIFENCKTFEDALKEIKITPVVAPVIITLVGAKKGQAVAIERGTNSCKVIKHKSPVLAVANHYIENEKGRSYEELWEDEDLNYTFRRKLIIEDKADKLKVKTLSDAYKFLQYDPVFNGYTAQSMIFSIRTGKALIRTYEQ